MVDVRACDLLRWVDRIRPDVADRFAQPLTDACGRFGISTPQRVAYFLGQVAEESGALSRLDENLNYSAEALCRLWPKRFPSPGIADTYARRPQAIANRIYGGRMGNGDEASGDGWRYRGRGLVQLTGRAAYRDCGKAIGIDLEAQPDLLLLPSYAALSAAWCWDRVGGNALADAGDIDAISDRLNIGHDTERYGDAINFEARVRCTNYALAAMGLPTIEGRAA